MIHLLVGNTGAGKSTYANKLKLNIRIKPKIFFIFSSDG